jgi:uncharacterized membrane protein YhaH (DUF805 family)
VSPPPDLARTSRSWHASRARFDLVALLVAGVLLYVVLVRTEAFEHFTAWSRTHEAWQLDEVLIALALLAVACAIYALRRWRDLDREVARRERAERANERLEGLLPICASCKRIRDAVGEWVAVEEYVAARTEAAFTHGICPECRQRLYPEIPA